MSSSLRREVDDRRLRPIYEALDSRDYKRALKLTANDLKKYPDSAALRSLRAVSLDRLSRHAEALSLCDEVALEVPTEDSVIVTLNMVYKAHNEGKKEVALLEAAAAAKPTEPHLVEMLAGSYVRNRMWSKAQQVHMRMYKLTKEIEYLFAASTCLEMQAASAEGTGMAEAPLLSLASTLVERSVTAEEWTGEGMRLQISLLEKLEKYEEACTLLETKEACRLLMELDRRRMLAQLERKRGRGQVAGAHYMAILRMYPDDWEAMLGVFDIYERERIDAIVEEVQAVAAETGGRLRGPMLAKVELSHRDVRMMEGGDGENNNKAVRQNFVQAVREYVEYVGDKECCADDLSGYFADLDDELREQLADGLRAIVSFEDVAETDDRLRILDTMHTINAKLGFTVWKCEGDVLIRSLLQQYQRSAERCAERHLDEREARPGERMLTLAVDLLIRQGLQAEGVGQKQGYGTVFDFEDKVKYTNTVLEMLLVAACILEAGVQTSPYSYDFRIQKLKVYGYLGAVSKAWQDWNMLQVKNIQLDTLSYLIIPHVVAVDARQYSDKLLFDVFKYHRNHLREFGDTINNALNAGNYSQVADFCDFRDRLERSKTNTTARTELALSVLARQSVCDEIEDMSGRNRYERATNEPELSVDNSDMKHIPGWARCSPEREAQLCTVVRDWWRQSPPRSCQSEKNGESSVDFLQLRKSFAKVGFLLITALTQEATEYAVVLEVLATMQCIRKAGGDHAHRATVKNGNDDHVTCGLILQCLQVGSDVLELKHKLNAGIDSDSDQCVALCEKIRTQLHDSSTRLEWIVKDRCADLAIFFLHSGNLSNVAVLVNEIISISSLCVRLCMHTACQVRKKKKKKKNADIVISELVVAIQASAKDLVKALQTVIAALEGAICYSHICVPSENRLVPEECLAKYDLPMMTDEIKKAVTEDIEESQGAALTSITDHAKALLVVMQKVAGG